MSGTQQTRQLLLQQPVTGHRIPAGSRTAAKDCSHNEASDRLRSLDPKCILAGPWMFLPLLPVQCRMSEVTSLVSFTSGISEVRFFALFALGQVCKAGLVAQKTRKLELKRKVLCANIELIRYEEHSGLALLKRSGAK